MSAESRPSRLSRETEVLRRENARLTLERYTAERLRFLQRKEQHQRLCNVGEDHQDNERSTSQPIDAPASQSQHSRSRSPISPIASQANAIVLYEPAGPLTLHSPSLELQVLQMHIGIQRNILETIERLPDRVQSPEEIVISDNESDADVDEYQGIQTYPLRVVTHIGKGRHIRYQVIWSDNRETLHKKQELSEKWKWIYEEYQAKLNRDRVAKSRAKKKERERNNQS